MTSWSTKKLLWNTFCSQSILTSECFIVEAMKCITTRCKVLREVMCSKLPGRIIEMLLYDKSSLVMLLSISDKGSSVKRQLKQSNVVLILLQHDCPELDIASWNPAITKKRILINRAIFRFHKPLWTEMFINQSFLTITFQIWSWNPEIILSKIAL